MLVLGIAFQVVLVLLVQTRTLSPFDRIRTSAIPLAAVAGSLLLGADTVFPLEIDGRVTHPLPWVVLLASILIANRLAAARVAALAAGKNVIVEAEPVNSAP